MHSTAGLLAASLLPAIIASQQIETGFYEA